MIAGFHISDNLIQSFVWTIVNSIWQFTLIAVVMSVLLKVYSNTKSVIRYAISLTSIFASFGIFITTFLYYYSGQSADQIRYFSTRLADYQANFPDVTTSDQLYIWITTYQNPIIITWMIGVALFAVRILGSALYIEYLSRKIKPVYDLEIHKRFDRICRHFGVHPDIKIAESGLVTTPMLLGFLKPVILFPIGLINQLDPAETEAILAHELAHFLRKDVYINLIQTGIEAVLYYHPAIWWISTNIRVERENCCDEMAISYTGDPLHYAKTLVKIQEINHAIPSLAMTFSNKNNFFTNRIKRILNMAQTRNFLKEKILISSVLLLLVLFLSQNVTGSQQLNVTENKSEIPTLQPLAIDSIPSKKESIRIQKKSNDQELKMSLENGEVTELEIDGKVIDKSDYGKYSDIIDENKPKNLGNGNAQMFFFGDGGEGAFKFGMGDEINIDSLFGHLDMKNFGDHNMLRMDGNQMAEQMKKLQEQLGKMQFNFDMPDSMNFDFAFPDLNKQFKHFELRDGDFFSGPNIDGEDDMDIRGESGSRNFSETIGNALNRDGLLIPNEQNKVELTGKYLKINGDKQPQNIFHKYKRIFEEASGSTLQKNSRLEFNFEGKESKRKYRVY